MRTITALARNAMLACVSMIVVTACSSGPDIRREVNPTANFASYKTFGYFPELATDRAGYETVFTARLKAATRSNLEAKGYVYSETNPDLLVNFYANVEDKQELRSTPTSMGYPVSMGYYGYRHNMYYGMSTSQVETVSYKQGTLTIDLVDPTKKALVWSATAEGRVSKDARKNPGPAIDAVVAELMQPLPAASTM
jgi:hypothetical protein